MGGRALYRILFSLFALFSGAELLSVTRPNSKSIDLPINIDQVLPPDTLKAGRDLELRKIQSMLSGQKQKFELVQDPNA